MSIGKEKIILIYSNIETLPIVIPAATLSSHSCFAYDIISLPSTKKGWRKFFFPNSYDWKIILGLFNETHTTCGSTKLCMLIIEKVEASFFFICIFLFFLFFFDIGFLYVYDMKGRYTKEIKIKANRWSIIFMHYALFFLRKNYWHD